MNVEPRQGHASQDLSNMADTQATRRGYHIRGKKNTESQPWLNLRLPLEHGKVWFGGFQSQTDLGLSAVSFLSEREQGI